MQTCISFGKTKVTGLAAACLLSGRTPLRAPEAVMVPQRSMRSAEYASFVETLHHSAMDGWQSGTLATERTSGHLAPLGVEIRRRLALVPGKQRVDQRFGLGRKQLKRRRCAGERSANGGPAIDAAGAISEHLKGKITISRRFILAFIAGPPGEDYSPLVPLPMADPVGACTLIPASQLPYPDVIPSEGGLPRAVSSAGNPSRGISTGYTDSGTALGRVNTK